MHFCIRRICSASDRCIRIRVSEYQINLSIDTERNLCNGPMVHGVVARWQINFPLCNTASHLAIILLAGTGQTVQLCCVCLNKGCCWLCCWVGVFYAKFDNIQCLLFSVMRSGAGAAAARRGRGLSDFDQLRARICRIQDLEVIVLSSTTHLRSFSLLVHGTINILGQVSQYI